MFNNQLSWIIGGAQGSGVDSAANIFGRACNFGGLWVFGKREYYSNIMGEHSYYHMRIEDQEVRSNHDSTDLLTTFDAETIVRHYDSVSDNGAIIFDPKFNKTKLSQIHTLGHRLTSDVTDILEKNGLDSTIAGVIELARQRNSKIYPIGYDDVIKQLADELGTQLSQASRTINTISVSMSFGLLGFDFKFLEKAINSIFGHRPEVAKLNIDAAKKTYSYAESVKSDFQFKLEPIPSTGKRLYLQGNQAVAIGKILSGCRFQTYYPISPATDESVYLEGHDVFDLNLPDIADNPQIEEAAMMNNKGNIIVLQTEDEIAAIASAMGASLSGARSSTSTSGPGFDLMVEGLGWAGMNEVPVVVTLYQRGGPSTGLPTRTEQSELKLALTSGHGEFPKIVLASGDHEECFYDAALAFNYADKYQTVVVHIVDKAIANSHRTFPMFDTDKIRIDRGEMITDDIVDEDPISIDENSFKRFKHTDSGISPRSIIGVKGGIYWATGDEHDEFGRITEDPVLRRIIHEKRMKKLTLADKEIPVEQRFNYFGDSNADIIIVSWGSSKGAILDALPLFESKGLKVGFLQLRVMSPFPKDSVIDILSKAKTLINMEMNFTSQLADVIREQTGVNIEHRVVKYTGRPISRDEVYLAVQKILSTGDKRVVLTSGA